MAAYVIAQLEVLDRETYAEFRRRFPGMVEAFGGKLLGRGVKGIHKTYHCGGGIVYHRRDEREPYGTWSGDCLVAREESSGVS